MVLFFSGTRDRGARCAILGSLYMVRWGKMLQKAPMGGLIGEQLFYPSKPYPRKSKAIPK